MDKKEMRKLKKSFSPEKIVVGACVLGCAAIAFRSVRLIGIGAALLCRGLKQRSKKDRKELNRLRRDF